MANIIIKDRHIQTLNFRELAAMTEDLMFDPVLAAQVILGLKIPPHQAIRIMLMWVTHYFQDDSGFSMGKTTTAAIVMALRSILFEDRKSLIVSPTFRQSQLVFSNLDRWYKNKNNFFHHCIDTRNNIPRISHAQTAWEMNFKGGSLVRALPPNFSEDSTGLRSERGHDGYFDEWTKFEISAYTKTLLGRISAVNEHQDCPIRQNHIAAFSTPGYESDPAYQVVEDVKRQMN